MPEEHISEEESVADEQGQVATDEWTIAALAHASVLVTLILSMAGGVGAIVGPAIPLVMYLGYRERSRFVAFHSLQAFVYQITCIILYIVISAALGGVVAITWTVAGILSVILIGLLMMPFAGVLTILMVVILVGAPFAWGAYGLYGAYMVYQGSNFRYWQIGDILEREVSG